MVPRISNWQEVERRLANLIQTTKSNNTTITKTNNSLNSFLSSLAINLKDLLSSQGDISLWFFNEDKPTLLNQPYIDWENKSEHYGDIFYSKTKGSIYQFKENGEWEILNDETLRKAMALTNESIDGNERKIFTISPSPPYKSGDWYIQEDGTLLICQIGREDGQYNKADFVTSVQYAGSIAKQTGNTLDVLKGTVITTSDRAVTYLDRATNTTTEISGDSIKSGMITSNNYIKNNVGMQINLKEGMIDTKNFKVDKEGNVNLYNGAKVISEKGLLTNLQFQGINNNFGLCGCDTLYNKDENISIPINFNVSIPDGFTVVSANIELSHQPIKWHYTDENGNNDTSVWGYIRDLAIFKEDLNAISEWYWQSDLGYEQSKIIKVNGVSWKTLNGRNQGKITSNIWTAWIAADSEHIIEKVKTNDIKDVLDLNNNHTQRILIKPNSLPGFIRNNIYANNRNCAERTAKIIATLNVYGYSNF